MTIVLAIIFSVFILFLFKRIKLVRGTTGVASAFILSYWFYYALIPLLIGFISNKNIKSKIFFDTFMQGGGIGDSLYFFIITLYIIIFIVSYVNTKSYTRYEINYNRFYKYIKLAGYMSLFGGGICLLFYFHLLGGLSQALVYAEFNRSFANSMEDVMAQYFILFRPAKLIIIAPFCCFFLFIRDKKSKKQLFYFGVSIVLALLFYLYDASRSSLMIYLVALSFPLIQRYIHHPWIIIFVGGLLGLNLLNLLDSLFIYFASGEFNVEDFNFDSILCQFAHPYRNVSFSFDIALQEGIRLGKDFITDFLNFIPGVNFDASYEPTSEFFSGADWRVTGGIPNDIITFSIIEFFMLGIIIIPYILGKIIRKLDNFFTIAFQENQLKYPVSVLQAYIMMLVFFNTASSDFSAILQGYSLFVFFFIPIYSLRIK